MLDFQSVPDEKWAKWVDDLSASDYLSLFKNPAFKEKEEAVGQRMAAKRQGSRVVIR